MRRYPSFFDQGPKAGLPSHSAPQPKLTTFLAAGPARVTKAVRHLQQRRKMCCFIEGSCKRESPDSGRESVDQLLKALRAAEKWRVGRAERGLDPLRWLVQLRRLRVSKSEDLVVIPKEKKSEEPWRMSALYSQMPRLFWRASSHRLCSSFAAIGLIAVTAKTNGRAVPALF